MKNHQTFLSNDLNTINAPSISNLSNYGNVSVDQSLKYEDKNILSVNLDKNQFKVDGNVKLNLSDKFFEVDREIKLKYDPTDFYLDNTGLHLLHKSNYYYESGYKRLDIFNSVVRSSNGKVWPCSYYIRASNCGGVVNMGVEIMLDRSKITDIGSNPGDTPNAVYFTFIINPSTNPEGNHSNLEMNKFIPSNEYFIPDDEVYSIYTYKIGSKDTNWFINMNQSNGKFSDITPISPRTSFRWNKSSFKYVVGTVNVTPTPPKVIIVIFNLACVDGSWYSQNTGNVYVGPVFLQYVSRR